MAIAHVRNHGTTDLTGTGTTITKVPTATIPVGNHVVMVVRTQTTGLTVSAADTQGNTYQVDLTHNADARATYVISARITTQLTTSDTITITYSSTAAQRSMGLTEWSGLATSSWKDQGTTGTGTSTSPNSGNVTTTQADELLFGAFGYNAGGGAFTQGASYTLLNNIQNGGSGQWLASEYQIVAATGTYSASGTITSTGWTAQIVTYKGGGGTTHTASADVAGSGAIAGSATRKALASPSISGTGATAASATRIALGSAQVAGAGAVNGAGGVIRVGAASVAGTGTINATARYTAIGTASVSGTGTIAASVTTPGRRWPGSTDSHWAADTDSRWVGA